MRTYKHKYKFLWWVGYKPHWFLNILWSRAWCDSYKILNFRAIFSLVILIKRILIKKKRCKRFCRVELPIFQIWFLENKFSAKWLLFDKQQVSSVMPQRCDNNFIEIFHVWVTKVCLSFSLNCFFQILENVAVKIHLFCLFCQNIGLFQKCGVFFKKKKANFCCRYL